MTAVQLRIGGPPLKKGLRWARSLVPMEPGAATWPDLAVAFGHLGSTWRLERRAAYVALLPPLTQVRFLDLPRLKDHELRRVIAKGARRYFPTGTEPQVPGAIVVRRGKTGAPPVFTASAPERVVKAVLSAAAEASWSVTSMVSAVSTWCAGALRSWPVLYKTGGDVVVFHDEGIVFLRMRSGALGLVRRWPRSYGVERVMGTLRELRQTTEKADGPIAIVGLPEFRRQVAAAEDLGPILLAAPRLGVSPDSPDEFCAAHAAISQGPEILPERVHVERRRRGRNQALLFAAAALALLGVAASAQWWGQARELDAIRARREQIRGAVANAVDVRDSATGAGRLVARLANLEANAPRWSLAIAAVARDLPSDAYLLTVRGEADSMVLEGVASRAAQAFDSLRRSPQVAGIRALAPIRRDMRDGRRPLDRFTFAVRFVAGIVGGPP